MYTYKLIDGGYKIFHNNRLLLKQDRFPNNTELGGMDEDTAERMAKLVILKLRNNKSPFISLEEEAKLTTEELNDSDIENMIEG